MFSVLLSNAAKKQLKLLPKDYNERVVILLERFEQEPVPSKAYDVRKIGGRDETYRVRLSSFRVEYRVFWEEKTVWVAFIERRTGSTYQ
ncbi:MAG: type II toxin-antitoxin system RelE/ParE family toxin [Candidatus Micrarchaeota archaeon]